MKPIKVLVADDSQPVLERVVKILAAIPGVEIVGQARDGVEAMDRFRDLSPDALVLDLQLPNLSGIEVLKFAKRQKPEAVVIILTNYGFPVYRQTCLAQGADFFFDKSLEFEKVGDTIARLLKEPDEIR